MSISQGQVNKLISSINKKIQKKGISFVLTAHFALDRLNDLRNIPPIELSELELILNNLISNHIFDIAKLPNNASFNIKCKTSHINMPCVVNKTVSAGKSLHKNVIITVMRKSTFVAKDPTEFIV
ncbi:hypothetical protein [Pseudoalteromonas fuliginea]|uniref:Uncharacterized protein n=1 Tax=Pseudoalteromonas fuliginea TaxID=1872678 RepID=A0ABQ6RDP3_9GAMM|nr:hypothetical protein [Pseudoalteromonas fuliginea]KAA1150861.1 hypothetical protein EU509_17290 [Pseudoalteromonas fuliginea]KAA1165534.1 hypothetical protein EUZ79_17280 [Pseudoalteromonas fuliginea]